jgi:predicted permease
MRSLHHSIEQGARALLSIFTNNLLPVLLIAGAGFCLGKILHVEARPLGRVIFYIFAPLLIFDLISRSQLAFDKILLMMGFAMTIMLVVGGLAFLAGKLFRLERTVLTAVVLTATFANNGNYGLPLVSFAFGGEALAYAGIYFVSSLILFYTLGILIASLGHLRFKEAMLGLLKVPAIYAIVLAMVFVRTGWALPDPLQRTITLAAGATVPCMLVLLGLELQHIEWNRDARALSIPVFLRLIIGPLIGIGMASLFGLPAAARQAGITEASTPSAVMNSVVATEYKLEPSLVTAIIFAGTVLSPLTITLVLFFLGR